HRELMAAILADRVRIADAVNAVAIPLEEAPQGYRSFDEGAASKYVLDPNGYLGAAAS
ncbi:formaldehyde dehydrogenase, glutathione-independent, partial [Nocardiopsis tropica]|nr:formaldehyde dehydrogenase, glutathione-independent [Nocardiopsis tropica]